MIKRAAFRFSEFLYGIPTSKKTIVHRNIKLVMI